MNRDQVIAAFCMLLVPVSVVIAVVLLYACQWLKVREAYGRHMEKIRDGHVVVGSTFQTWSDGCDVVIHYSNGGRIVIRDLGHIPSWAEPKTKGG